MKALDYALNTENLPEIEDIIIDAIKNEISDSKNTHHTYEKGDPVFHPSFVGKCPRQIYYSFVITQEEAEFEPDTIFHRICEVGNAMHKYYQNLLGDAGVLYGDYYCRYCKETVVKNGFKPKACHICGRDGGLEYSEKTLKMESPLIMHGHGDGIIIPDLSVNKGYFMELKSMTHFMFDNKYVQLPLDEHQHQLNTYLGICRFVYVKEKPFYLKVKRRYDINDGFILYENKSTQERKIFWQSFDEDMFKDDLKHSRMIVRHIKKKVVPARPTKYHKKAAKCKRCGYFDLCYEND